MSHPSVFLPRWLLVGLALLPLAACVSTGDSAAVRDANVLAISCQTNAALAAANRAAAGGGISGSVAELQKVVILHDAGRVGAASAAMEARNANPYVDARNAAEAEAAVQKAVSDLRDERERTTGQRTCE